MECGGRWKSMKQVCHSFVMVCHNPIGDLFLPVLSAKMPWQDFPVDRVGDISYTASWG